MTCEGRYVQRRSTNGACPMCIRPPLYVAPTLRHYRLSIGVPLLCVVVTQDGYGRDRVGDRWLA
eukprot:47161-Eustigmatos_ZCMA.PRE.1